MKMTDMKRTKAETKENDGPMKSSGDSYPYGLSVHLDHHALKKLGMHDKLPRVGDRIKLHAHAHVTSVSQDSREGGKPNSRVELQLRHMGVEHGADKGMGKSGDTEAAMNKGMKGAIDKAMPKGPKEEGSEEPDGDEA